MAYNVISCQKVAENTQILNIAKGTTDPRVEFILPEGWVHLAKVPSWGRITSSTAVMWTRTGNLTNYTSKNPLQVASGPHPLRRARGLSKELVPNVQLWMKHQALPSHTRPIKFTKQEWVSEWVREVVTDKHNQWSDSGPIKIQTYCNFAWKLLFRNAFKMFLCYFSCPDSSDCDS